jgi:hypothetical protein
MSKSNQRPVHEIRFGCITAAIWRQETANGVFHNVSITRIYRDEKDEWQRSTSFGRDDLPLVQKVADRAHSWIYEHGREKSEAA